MFLLLGVWLKATTRGHVFFTGVLPFTVVCLHGETAESIYSDMATVDGHRAIEEAESLQNELYMHYHGVSPSLNVGR